MRQLSKRWLYSSVLVVLGVIVTGCPSAVGPPSVPEEQEVEPSEPAMGSYDIIGFWDFENGINSPVGIQSAWELRHVDRHDGIASFDGIYDLSDDEEGERGNVSIAGLDPKAFTLAARFRLPTGVDTSNRPIPILVGGHSHRWLVVEVEQDELTIDLNNHDLRYPTGINVPRAVLTELVVSVDVKSGELTVALGAEPPATIDLPANFDWNFSVDPLEGTFLSLLCVQDYSNGNAFVGDLDWVFVASGVLTPGEVKYLTEGGVSASAFQEAATRDLFFASERERLESGALTHSYRAFADVFTNVEGLRGTVNTSLTSSSYISVNGEYRNYQPVSSSVSTVSNGVLYHGTSSGLVTLNDPEADVWRVGSYRVHATGSAGDSVSIVVRSDGPGGDIVGQDSHVFDGAFDGLLTLQPSMDGVSASTQLHFEWSISSGARVKVNVVSESNTTFLTMGSGVLEPVDLDDDPDSGWSFSWERVSERDLVADVDFPRVPQRVYLALEGAFGDTTFSLEDEDGVSIGALTPGVVHDLNVDWAPTRLVIHQPDGSASAVTEYVLLWE